MTRTLSMQGTMGSIRQHHNRAQSLSRPLRLGSSRAARHLRVCAVACLVVLIVPLAATAALNDPLQGKCGDIRVCVQNVVQYALGLAGILALAGIVYGGFRYMTAAGSQEGIEAGKNAVTYSVVGLIIIGLAYAIVQAVFEALGGSGGGVGT